MGSKGKNDRNKNIQFFLFFWFVGEVCQLNNEGWAQWVREIGILTPGSSQTVVFKIFLAPSCLFSL